MAKPRHSQAFAVVVLVPVLLSLADPVRADPVAVCGGTGGAPPTSGRAGSAGAKVINSVPAYSWYHGCGPTAAAAVFGFWDVSGFRNLFDASDRDVFLTSNVQDHISSPAHNAKYDPTPDAPGPAPAFTSIADWFYTSVDPLGFGWSFLSFAENAFEGYASHRGYQFEAETRTFGGPPGDGVFTWESLIREIDGNRPLLSLVDTDGNGATDHFIPVLGYDDRGALGKYYGFYTTWDENETITWEPFRPLGNPWGIGYATFVNPLSAPEPVPEPASLLLVAAGGASLIAARRRKRGGSPSVGRCR